VRRRVRVGIIERANPAAPTGEKALFDLATCLPRILSYVAEKRELTPQERALAAARLRVMETRAKQAEWITGNVAASSVPRPLRLFQ